MTIRPDERISFDMYFCALASMSLHPGAGTREHKQITLPECRDMAIEMLQLRREAIGNEEKVSFHSQP